MFKWVSDAVGEYIPDSVKKNDIFKGFGLDGSPEGTLMNACMLGSITKTSQMIDEGIDIHIKNDKGNGLVHVACYNGHLNIITKLLDSGIDINVLGELGNTPLHIAVKRNHEDLVYYLVENGADVKIQNREGLKASDMTRDFKIRKLLLTTMFPRNLSNSCEILGQGGVPLESPSATGPEGGFFGGSSSVDSSINFKDLRASNFGQGMDGGFITPDGFVSSAGTALGEKYGNRKIDQKKLFEIGAPPTAGAGSYYSAPPSIELAGGGSSSTIPFLAGMPPRSTPYSRGRYVAYDAINNKPGEAYVPSSTASRRSSMGVPGSFSYNDTRRSSMGPPGAFFSNNSVDSKNGDTVLLSSASMQNEGPATYTGGVFSPTKSGTSRKQLTAEIERKE